MSEEEHWPILGDSIGACGEVKCRPITLAAMMLSVMKIALLALVMLVFLAVTSEARTLLDYDSCYNGEGTFTKPNLEFMGLRLFLFL